MYLQTLIREVTLLIFVVAIRWDSSTTMADDSGFSNDSEEVGVDSTEKSQAINSNPMLSATTSLFRRVAATRRTPRFIDHGCILGPFCASDGHIYDDDCELIRRGLTLMPNMKWCDRGCAQPHECSTKRVPVCADINDVFTVFNDECELKIKQCQDLADNKKVAEVVPIGRCQTEVNVSRLTCDDILRGRCPHGTVLDRVCEITGFELHTYKNLCRVLHKRCKKNDNTCYHLHRRCPAEWDTEIPPLQDCSQYILPSATIRARAKTCYVKHTSSELQCHCEVNTLPRLPVFPEILKR